MKKNLISLALLMSTMSMNAAVSVDRIEPTNWYVGMKDTSLQLMVYGKDVRNADVEINYPGVRIDSIARLDSPNYLLVYLNIDGAKAGEMTLNFKQGKQSKLPSVGCRPPIKRLAQHPRVARRPGKRQQGWHH